MFACAGFGSSLAKDVPFAALYWSMLEPLRGALMVDDTRAVVRRLRPGGEPPPPPHLAAHVPPTSLKILVVNIGAAGGGSALGLALCVVPPCFVCCLPGCPPRPAPPPSGDSRL